MSCAAAHRREGNEGPSYCALSSSRGWAALVLGARCFENVQQAVVSLVTCVFIKRGIGLHHRNRCRPPFGKGGWIVHGDFVVDRIGIDKREALDQMEMRGLAKTIYH